MSIDPLPPLAKSALLLDLDGTLLDMAPRPDAVVVPPGLLDTLCTLRDRLGGTLAVITGRTIDIVNSLLHEAPYAVAGEHGGAVRHAPGDHIERPDLPSLPEPWFEAAQRLAAAHPGAVLERKARGFALHYRGVPEAGPRFHAELSALLSASPDFELLPARMLWEVRPRGVDKGSAVRALMARAPFARRAPIFIGDDVTDEDGIRAARALGGAGLRVDAAFATPSGLRAWLRDAAEADEWPAPPGDPSCG